MNSKLFAIGHDNKILLFLGAQAPGFGQRDRICNGLSSRQNSKTSRDQWLSCQWISSLPSFWNYLRARIFWMECNSLKTDNQIRRFQLALAFNAVKLIIRKSGLTYTCYTSLVERLQGTIELFLRIKNLHNLVFNIICFDLLWAFITSKSRKGDLCRAAHNL